MARDDSAARRAVETAPGGYRRQVRLRGLRSLLLHGALTGRGMPSPLRNRQTGAWYQEHDTLAPMDNTGRATQHIVSYSSRTTSGATSASSPCAGRCSGLGVSVSSSTQSVEATKA